LTVRQQRGTKGTTIGAVRVASIDIGTNSTRLLVADVDHERVDAVRRH